MSVDKFGHHVYRKQKIELDLTNLSLFKNTGNANLDAENKIIKHLKTPVDSQDAVNKEYVDQLRHYCESSNLRLQELITDLKNCVTKLESEKEKLGKIPVVTKEYIEKYIENYFGNKLKIQNLVSDLSIRIAKLESDKKKTEKPLNKK